MEDRFWMVMRRDKKNSHDSRKAAEDDAKQLAKDSDEMFFVLEATNAFVRGEAPIRKVALENPAMEAPDND